MNAKRQKSLMLAAIWACAVGLPASSAGAHGNNPKYGIEDDTLDQPPKEPPHAGFDPSIRAMIEHAYSVVSTRRAGVQAGLPDVSGDLDASFGWQEVDSFLDPAGGMRALLLPAGPGPYAGPESPDLGGLLPGTDLGMPPLPGLPQGGGVPAPGTLAILGLAAAIAGRRRRRHD